MNRQEKELWIRTLKAELACVSGAVLVRQVGLDASKTFEFRQAVRQARSSFKIVKNTLAHIALQGTSFEPMCDHLVGPLGLVYGASILDVSKAVVQYSDKNENIQIVTGMMDNQVLDLVAIKQLATLPDIDTLRSKLVAVLQAPARHMLGIVQAPAAQLARVFSAYGASHH